jgi:hypothetical protein
LIGLISEVNGDFLLLAVLFGIIHPMVSLQFLTNFTLLIWEEGNTSPFLDSSSGIPLLQKGKLCFEEVLLQFHLEFKVPDQLKAIQI